MDPAINNVIAQRRTPLAAARFNGVRSGALSAPQNAGTIAFSTPKTND